MEKPALGCIKLSLIIWYRKIFRGRRFNIASWIAGAIVLIWAVSFFIAQVFACRPVHIIYTGTIKEFLTQCIDTVAMLEAFAITDVLTDIMVLSLPLPMVWSLQMSPQRKAIVCGIFLLGAL